MVNRVALKKALIIEGIEGDFYKNCLTRTRDDEGRNTFRRVIEEKEKHIHEIKQILGNNNETNEESVYEENMVEVISYDVNEDYDVIDALNVCIDNSRRVMAEYECLGLAEMRQKEEYLIQELEEDMKSHMKTGAWWDFRVVGH